MQKRVEELGTIVKNMQNSPDRRYYMQERNRLIEEAKKLVAGGPSASAPRPVAGRVFNFDDHELKVLECYTKGYGEGPHVTVHGEWIDTLGLEVM